MAERKIVFISKTPSLLYHCIAALCSLLYPLKWVLVIAPNFKVNGLAEINNLLEFPQGFIYGINSENGLAIPADVCVTNLDNNTVINKLFFNKKLANEDALGDRLNELKISLCEKKQSK